MTIPEIDLALQRGTLGGLFTTVEGILEQVCSASSVSPLHCIRENLEDVSQGAETPNDGQVLSLKELEA